MSTGSGLFSTLISYTPFGCLTGAGIDLEAETPKSQEMVDMSGQPAMPETEQSEAANKEEPSE
jgi:hypothetical protein